MRGAACLALLLGALGLGGAVEASTTTATTATATTATASRPSKAPLTVEPDAGAPPARRARPRPRVVEGPTRHFRASVGILGRVEGLPWTPGATDTWRGASSAGVGAELSLAFDRWEWVAAMQYSQANLSRRALPAGGEASDGPSVVWNAGLRLDLDGEADGLGWHAGAGLGIRAFSSDLDVWRADPRCAGCRVREWGADSSFFTFAFVPSLLWRQALTEGAFRIAWQVEGAVWLGGRSHAIDFSGEATDATIAGYGELTRGRSSGFFSAATVRLGLRFGYAGRTRLADRPATSGPTHQYRPPPPPPPEPRRRW